MICIYYACMYVMYVQYVCMNVCMYVCMSLVNNDLLQIIIFLTLSI